MRKILIIPIIVLDLYLMVTAGPIVSVTAFVIGMVFLFHYVFEIEDKEEQKTNHTKKD
ncbi:hypothetical protein [Companilactobacillus kimchiensis]|nr:hypothetical protein [Companilactobacillus kimchiensis]